jgi:diguanylate cyclase (GGDEF)-like protein
VSSPAIVSLRPTRALVACVVAVAWSVGWFALGLTRTTPPALGWPAVAVTVPIAAYLLWRAGRSGRTLWRYVAIGVLFDGLGVAVSGNRREPHVGGFTSALFGLALLIILAGLFRIRGGRRTPIEWIRFGLDIATGIVTVVTFAWHLAYPRWHAWAGADPGARMAAVIVIGAGLVGVSAFVKVAFTGTGSIDRRALHLLGVAGAVGAATGGAMAPLLATRPYVNSGQVQLPVLCLLLVLAADRQVRATRAGPALPQPARRQWSLMPYLAVLATGGLLLGSEIRRSPDGLIVASGAVAVTLLVAARQIITLRDNAGLVGKLAHQAGHDALTGLANRTVLNRRTAEALASGHGTVGLALIDLDNFKAINDDLGHAAGDALLAAVARRIEAVVPAGGVTARLGGDEYALMLLGDHESVLAAITAEMRRPVQAFGQELVVQASIGLAVADGPDVTAEELLRRADVAMYQAKSRGKGRYVRYDPGMDQQGAEQARLAADLRTALDAGDLQLHYQPIVTIHDGAMVCVESLIRWTHPERGPISPATFIPAAERTGLIVPLGLWILTEACRQAVQWRSTLGARAPESVAVNVSARQLREDGFADEVAAILVRTGMPASMLTVEVTETAVFDSAVAVAELHAIRALGVRVALDDFGTGHSSLSVLRTCRADVIKLDKSFVDDITSGGEEAVVAAALLQISEGFRLRAVAEGIETAAQASELYRLGYRYGQGYYFGRPVPADGIASFREVLPAA